MRYRGPVSYMVCWGPGPGQAVAKLCLFEKHNSGGYLVLWA